MVRQGGSMEQSTTTTITTTTTSSTTSCIDRNYMKSSDGFLKLIQAGVLLIAFVCVHCSLWTNYSTYRYFEIVAIWFLIMALMFYLIYFTRLHLKITCIKWSFTEFLHNVVATILLFIASAVAAANSHGFAGLASGAFFGFVATLLFGINAFLDFKMYRDPQPATIFT
ncbi:CKLF-like MARVEL transmembrane domain-containing protein 7 [Callorhinchus milii]|uniref:CKLF-like MARVEL transmembrane domain-containing protein 7 n=1 Tax=Callorhinchus milii TaxID=7868 RepID=K4GK16_CALMI|nr:CKLF-like MARVEL transmembrane domain-containing protein 7 [Callorhinchus milii]AFM88347.1 CKLF-like MARVEL transmembrane domain-containing protein 7 [Callorhinchus milii]